MEVSIGIILLQDAVEIFLSALCEQLDINLTGNEKFHEYIKKIEVEKKVSLPLKKQMNILNKQRVNIKHFSLLPNLEDCDNYANSVWLFFSELSLMFLEKDIDCISLAELIHDSRVRAYLKDAEESLNQCQYQDCQINCRKALYLAFEHKFDRRYIKGKSKENDKQMLSPVAREEYQKILDEVINNTFDFLKKNEEQIKNQLKEIGIELLIYENLMRLTPNMYFYEDNNKWAIEEDLCFIRKYNRDNAYYCLKNAIDILRKKQAFEMKKERDARRWLEKTDTIEIDGNNIILYKKASKKNGINCILQNGIKYTLLVEFRIIGLDGEDYYYSVCGNETSKKFGLLEVCGYISEKDLPFDYIELFKSV